MRPPLDMACADVAEPPMRAEADGPAWPAALFRLGVVCVALWVAIYIAAVVLW